MAQARVRPLLGLEEPEDPVSRSNAGFIISPDNWTLFTPYGCQETTIGNFPDAANGAAILREAVKLLARRTMSSSSARTMMPFISYAHMDDRVAAARPPAPLHDRGRRPGDAPYADAAAHRIDGLDDDSKLITHATGYVDPRGAETLRHVMSIISPAPTNQILHRESAV